MSACVSSIMITTFSVLTCYMLLILTVDEAEIIMTQYTVMSPRQSSRATPQSLGRADTDLLHVGTWYSRPDDPMSVSYTLPHPRETILISCFQGSTSFNPRRKSDLGGRPPGGHPRDANAGLAG